MNVKILLVDAEKQFLATTKEYLSKINAKYAITTTQSVTTAKNLLKDNEFDIIISEYDLPKMNGLELLSDIRSLGQNTSFIFFTKKVEKEVLIKALNQGADYYIQKEGEVTKQLEILANYIEKSVIRKGLRKKLDDNDGPPLSETIEETLNLERKAFQLIAESAISKTKLTTLCIDVLRDLITTLSFDFGTIRLYDPVTEILKIYAIYGLSPKEQKLVVDHKIDESQYMSSHVAKSRVAIIAPDAIKSKELEQFKNRIKLMNIKSIITWPITSSTNELLGVVHLASRKIKDIPDEKWIFFETIVRFFATILERRKTNEMLRQNEERYRKLVEAYPFAILVTNLEGKVIVVNQESLTLSGYDNVEEMIGMSAFDFIAKEDQKLVMENLEQTLKKGKIENVQYKMLRKDGSSYIAELNVSLLVDTDGKPTAFLAIVQDITKKLRAQEAITHHQIELKKQRDELESFASTIAHDIRGKLQVIMMYNSMCESEYGYKIEQQVNEITKFLEDLLLLAKEGEILGEKSKVNLNDLVKEIKLEINSLDPNLKIKIDNLPTLFVDKVKFKQVLENLLFNVVKHADATVVKIVGKEFPNKYHIEIADNGRGMSIEKQREIRKIWTKKRFSSFGLLIAIKIIEAHNGSIGFESEEGLGTTFVISFPKNKKK